MVAYWDKNQVCVFANNAYHDWFGKTRQEMVGLKLKDLLGPLYAKYLPYIAAAYAGQKQIFERSIQSRDGAVHHGLVTLTPHEIDGEVHGLFVHVANIGFLKSKELGPQAVAAETNSRAQSDLSTGPTSPGTIGLLEDDEDQSRLVTAILSSAGFAVEHFKSLTDLDQNVAVASRCDAMLLDWSLPDGTAIEILRAAPPIGTRRIPLIVLTAHANESNIIAGLEAGADDYVAKPARPGELIARIQAALRRVEKRATSPLADFAPYSVDEEREEILINNIPAGLTAREFAIALYLFQRQGQAVTRKAIHSDVFKHGPQVLTRSLDTHVSRLRRKLCLDGRHGLELVSIYQTGYRLRRT